MSRQQRRRSTTMMMMMMTNLCQTQNRTSKPYVLCYRYWTAIRLFYSLSRTKQSKTIKTPDKCTYRHYRNGVGDEFFNGRCIYSTLYLRDDSRKPKKKKRNSVLIYLRQNKINKHTKNKQQLEHNREEWHESNWFEPPEKRI